MIGPRVRATAALLFVFAAGALAGVFVDRHHHVPASGTVSPAQEHDIAIAELAEFLELDDQQVARIHAILDDNQQIVQQMWEQLRPEVQNAMQHVHEQIAAQLHPHQLERFHQWLNRHRTGPGLAH